MKRQMTVMYLLFGVLNAFFAGLIVSIGVNQDWDITMLTATLTFVTSAVLLMRAPFSRRNIDHMAVKILRFCVVAVFTFLDIMFIKEMLFEMYDASLLLGAVIISITIYLQLWMDSARSRYTTK